MEIIIVSRPNDEIKRLSSELNVHGYRCTCVGTDNALELAKKRLAGLLLIDLSSFPETNEFWRTLRQESRLPIIAITPLEKIDSLDGYADDFITRPCNAIELQARINRLVKTTTKTSSQQIIVGNLKIDPEKYEVYLDNHLVSLTFKEYELLRFLAGHPGKVYTRDALLNQVWGVDYFGGDRTVDVFIRRLRSKIEDETHNYIETVRNIGYRFINS